jgi:glycosyltransferase involved in cell wall biosynthesis
MIRPLRVALLTTESREYYKDYGNPQPYFGTAPDALLQGFAETSGVAVEVISCVRRPFESPVQLAPNIRYHAVLVPKIGWMSTGYQGCIRAVRRKLRELQPDIVHGQGTERDCAVTAVFSGYPNVLTIHGNMRRVAKVNRARPFSYAWLNAHLETWTIPRSDGVVCITHYTQEAIRNLARQTWVVPNAVDSRYLAAKPARESPPLILCVGYISHLKNQVPFIRALDELAARRPLRVVFLGHTTPGEPAGDEFKAIIQSRPWCEHPGFADRDALRGWLERASVLALPSLEDNCPMTVLEAMAAGTPVLAAKVGGLPDLVEDGVSGVFCDPLDPSSMRAGLARVLDDPALADAIAATARTQAMARFQPTVIARRHVEVYREVLHGRSATPA